MTVLSGHFSVALVPRILAEFIAANYNRRVTRHAGAARPTRKDIAMTVQTALAIALVAGLGAAQYILAFQSLRDLARRPRVRGGNKVAWALLILCLPIAGALIYSWMGPTSLLRRPQAPPAAPPTNRPLHYAGRTAASRRNITPITDARRRSGNRTATTRGPRRFTRTGS